MRRSAIWACTLLLAVGLLAAVGGGSQAAKQRALTVRLSAPLVAVAGKPMMLTARVSPARRGRPVLLERRTSSGAWVRAELVRQGRRAAVRIRVTARPLGFQAYRVRVRRAGGGWARSAPVRVRVTRQVELLTRRPSGDTGAGSTSWPEVSANGRYVAFASSTPDLLPGVGTGFAVYRHDRATGRNLLLTPGGDSDSYWATISADGSRVVFTSSASNLVPGDTNASNDMFLWQGGRIHLLSRSRNGGTGERGSFSGSISANGRYVAFSSLARDLLPGPVATTTQRLYRLDLRTGDLRLLDRGGNGASSEPVISDDGRRIVFTSEATNLAPGQSATWSTVLVWTQGQGIRNLTPGPDGHSLLPDLSRDGRRVVFQTTAGLAAGDGNGLSDVYLASLGGATSGMPFGLHWVTRGANNQSGAASLSADGTFAAFASEADNLVAGDGNGDLPDIFRWRVGAQAFQRVTRGASASEAPSLSGNGTVVAFESQDDDLAPGDANLRDDAFTYAYR
ncbi:MAG: hypothetical protein Q8O61_07970 [Nocardioides sp.]|nr:hypothetical protein [Nocardioides sp.]